MGKTGCFLYEAKKKGVAQQLRFVKFSPFNFDILEEAFFEILLDTPEVEEEQGRPTYLKKGDLLVFQKMQGEIVISFARNTRIDTKREDYPLKNSSGKHLFSLGKISNGNFQHITRETAEKISRFLSLNIVFVEREKDVTYRLISS